MPAEPIVVNAALAGMGMLLVAALGILWHLHAKFTELLGIITHPELGIVAMLKAVREEVKEVRGEVREVVERVGALERRRAR